MSFQIFKSVDFFRHSESVAFMSKTTLVENSDADNGPTCVCIFSEQNIVCSVSLYFFKSAGMRFFIWPVFISNVPDVYGFKINGRAVGSNRPMVELTGRTDIA